MGQSKIVGLIAALAIAAGIGWLAAGSNAESTDSTRNSASSSASASQGAANLAEGASGTDTSPYSAAGKQQRQEQLVMWQKRYERAEQLYSSYRDSTRYPFDSRPIAEHPDQVRPFAPIEEDRKLRNAKGEVAQGIKLRTSQERVFLSGAETVRFGVSAVDDAGKPVALTIRSSQAQSIPDSATLIKIIQTTVAFSDDGTGSGRYTGQLAPAAQGYQNYAGTIRLIVELTADGQAGFAQFDVIYSPSAPATWAGVREALEGGSLNFYAKADVRQAGRYVVSGRVDDANGVPFALVQFNDEVAAGSREFKLQVFGALVLDKRPAFPLRLRDVDGFLLIPDKFPDRATMARQPGVIHTSANYPLSRFSNAEWTSEERQRYLAEYSKDAETARQQVQSLSGN